MIGPDDLLARSDHAEALVSQSVVLSIIMPFHSLPPAPACFDPASMQALGGERLRH